MNVNKEFPLLSALATILASTEKSAIKHIGYDGMTAYEALAKSVSDTARAALDEYYQNEAE